MTDPFRNMRVTKCPSGSCDSSSFFSCGLPFSGKLKKPFPSGLLPFVPGSLISPGGGKASAVCVMVRYADKIMYDPCKAVYVLYHILQKVNGVNVRKNYPALL